MKISDTVKNHIKTDKKVKAALCIAFNIHFSTIERWISENKDNGPLTTHAATEVIKNNSTFELDEIIARDAVPA